MVRQTADHILKTFYKSNQMKGKNGQFIIFKVHHTSFQSDKRAGFQKLITVIYCRPQSGQKIKFDQHSPNRLFLNLRELLPHRTSAQ